MMVLYLKRFFGFSLTQLLISLGLTAVIAVIGIATFKALTKPVALESEKLRLRDRSDALKAFLRSEIERVPRIDSTDSGLNRMTSEVIVLHNNLLPYSLAGRMTRSSFAGYDIGKTFPSAEILNAEVPFDNEFFNIFSGYMDKNPFEPLLFSDRTEVLEGGAIDHGNNSDPVEVGSDKIIIYLDPTNPRLMNMADRQSLFSVGIETIKQIRFFPDDQELWYGKGASIIMEKNFNYNTPAYLVSGNIEAFDYRFTFTNYDLAVTKSIPSEPLGNITDDYTGEDGIPCEGPVYNRPATCVGWKDLESVIVSYTIAGNTRFTDADNAELNHGYYFENDLLKFKDQVRVYMKNYSGPGKLNQSGIDLSCQVLAPYICLAEDNPCLDQFTSDDPASPNWKGYLPGSDYCECGTPVGGEFQPNFEANHIDHGWNSPEGKAKLMACGRAFGCNYYKNDSYHPGYDNPAYFLGCKCMNDTLDLNGNVTEKNVSYSYIDGSYELVEKDLISGDPRSLGSVLISAAGDSNLSCRTWNLPPGPDGACHTAALDWVEGNYDGAGANWWSQTCECRARRTDYNGNNLGRMYFSVVNWAKLCDSNIDFTIDDPGAVPACSNTILYQGGAGPYFFKFKKFPADDPQAMDTTQRNACYCMKKKESYQFTPSSDFRDPASPAGPSGYSEYSLSLLAPNYETGLDVSCSDLQCQIWPKAKGCCVSNYYSEAEFIANGGDAADKEWRNYCSPGCSTINSLDALRRSMILGLDPTDPLPEWCGGTDPGNGQGGNQ